MKKEKKIGFSVRISTRWGHGRKRKEKKRKRRGQIEGPPKCFSSWVSDEVSEIESARQKFKKKQQNKREPFSFPFSFLFLFCCIFFLSYFFSVDDTAVFRRPKKKNRKQPLSLSMHSKRVNHFFLFHIRRNQNYKVDSKIVISFDNCSFSFQYNQTKPVPTSLLNIGNQWKPGKTR